MLIDSVYRQLLIIQKLLSITPLQVQSNSMQNESEIKCQEMLLTASQKVVSALQMIAMKKEKQKQYEQSIGSQWKEVRSKFFNHQIKQKLNQVPIQHKHQAEIIQLFMQAEQDSNNQRLLIDLDQSDKLYEYQQVIEQLNQSFRQLNQQFTLKQKNSHIITQIIQPKLTSLRFISLQYSLTLHQYYRYEISAFTLFKVVHKNKCLFSVTLKGVLVIQFKQFIRSMMQSRLSQIKENEEKNWMKDFTPLKSLKIAIDFEDDFCLTNKQEDICAMKDLKQFGGLFQQLSIIPVKIVLEQYQQLADVKNNLQVLWGQLSKIGKIKIKIAGEYGCDCTDQPLFIFVLQLLSSFTTITQLQFRGIIFYQVSINSFLTMEQTLSSIFENNKITHLQLYTCQNFPILPTITTLQIIHVWDISFRRQFSLMSELTQSNPYLQQITCINMEQEWSIDEELFNQLQRFCIQECYNTNLCISAHSPSNIKQLTIHQSNICNARLSVLFPKLANVAFGLELICTIPSLHLEVLFIQRNNIFAEKDLEAIDQKWPKLKQLIFRDCPNLNDGGWNACKFNGLIGLWIGVEILERRHPIRQQLRGRGIKVYQ